MTGKPATIGLIGLGRMGARLTEAAVSAGVHVIAALDQCETPFALNARTELGPVFTQDAQAFWKTGPDVVLIAATAPAHVPLLRDGIVAGTRRFVVEKPFCTGVAEGEAALQIIKESGARVVVNHGRRYCPNYATLAALDGAAHMGGLRAISVSLGAGGLGSLGVHFFDLFNRLFDGPPSSVTAITAGATLPNPRGSAFHDPGACVLLAWPDGRRAVLDMCDDIGIPPLLEFRFALGRVLIENEMTPWRLFYRNAEDRALPLTRYGQLNEEVNWPAFRPFGPIEMAVDAIRNALDDDKIVAGVDHALDAVRVFAAIRESMETGRTICLPINQAIARKTFAIP